MSRTVMGVFNNRADAEMAIEGLREIGVTDTDISYVSMNSEGKVEATDAVGDAAAGATSGAVTGGVIGAIAGLIVANGILPGLGTLIVAGPIATALGFTGAAATTVAGAITGAAAGGLVGALTGLGVSDEDAQMYESRVKSGGILVTATSDNATASDVFKKYNADEVREYTV